MPTLVNFPENRAERLTVLDVTNVTQTKLLESFFISTRHQFTAVVVRIRYRSQLDGRFAVHLCVDKECSGETTSWCCEVGRLPILLEPCLVRL